MEQHKHCHSSVVLNNIIMRDAMHNRLPPLQSFMEVRFTFDGQSSKCTDDLPPRKVLQPGEAPSLPMVTKSASDDDVVHFRRTHAEVDLDALTANCAAIRRHLGSNGQRIVAVLKADAYGHGAVACARHLSKTHAVDAFAVVLVEEGVELRRGGVHEVPILVMAGSFYGAYESVITHSLTPIIGNGVDLIAFSQAAKRMGQLLAVQIEMDVGMARLGFDMADLDMLKELLARLDNIVLVGVMAHPSHASSNDASVLNRQYVDFSRSVQELQEMNGIMPAPTHDGDLSSLSHFSNSAVIARLANGSTGNGELVRVGLALYGIQPMPASPIEGLKPVLSWHTSVVAVRTLNEGDTVSYGGVYAASRRTKVATLCIGFADGLPRSLYNTGFVMIHGQRAKIVGRMDFTMVDVTDILSDVEVGTKATIIGNEPGAPSVGEVAAWAGTITWEVLTSISKRVPRIHN